MGASTPPPKLIPSRHIAERLQLALLREWPEVASVLIQRHAFAQRQQRRAQCEHCRHMIPHAWPRQRYCSRRCGDAARNQRKREMSALRDRSRAASVARRQARRQP
jgi:hypothetical protein